MRMSIANAKLCEWPEKPEQISDDEAEKGAGKGLVSKPNGDPCSLYPSVGMGDNTVDSKLFHLPGHESLCQVALEKSTFIGYQCNTNLHLSDAYAPYLDTHITSLKLRKTKYGLDERDVCCEESQSSEVVKRTGYWIHVDGALGATYMPFLQMAHKAHLVPQCGPKFDFRLPFVHSITMSGHKWPGAPMPCGIYMTKTKHQLTPPGVAEYIGSRDTTFAGSRNGLSSMLLWDQLARTSYKEQIQRAVYSEALEDYTVHCLKMVEKCIQLDLYIERSPLSLSVIFRKPNESIIFKYSLSTERQDDKKYGHVYMMHSVTDKLVDSLIEALLHPDAFKDDSTPMEIIEPPSVPKANGVECVPYQGRGFH